VSKKYLETIKSIDGRIFNLEYHQWRLDSVLNSLNVKVKYNLSKLLLPPKVGVFRCRVVYDENDITVEYLAYTKRQINKLKLLYSDEIEYSKKYENREQIDRLLLQKDDCDDILIVKNSFITDTSIANIAFYDGVDWITPKQPLLLGTTRQRLLDKKQIIQKDIRPIEIKSFQKVALMNAMVDFDIIVQENIREIIC